jgi:hypothetical protein
MVGFSRDSGRDGDLYDFAASDVPTDDRGFDACFQFTQIA